MQLEQTVYALDSTIIDLCLSLFPWAKFRKRKGAIKLHTLLDMRGNIPTAVVITHGKVHDVNILDSMPIETGAIYIMDRGYIDYKRLYRIQQALAFFVTRAKSNFDFNRRISNPVNKLTGILCDQIVTLNGFYPRKDFPDKLRRIRYRDAETDKTLVFMTNNFTLPALTIAQLYHCRWKVELFFKWIKQHLRIKAFYGNNENAVKTQVWIAIAIYVLVAIIKKRLKLKYSLYKILQILSITLFEKTQLQQAFTDNIEIIKNDNTYNQLNLFN